MIDEPEFIGDWLRERVLGAGAFGTVTLWKNDVTKEKIAIKKYRGDPGNILSDKQKERWANEVEMMKKINNINIVGFHKLPTEFEDELKKCNPSNLPFLSMEFCTEGDLRSLLSRVENCCGLPEREIRYILNDLMNAVSYLHTLKITHRDLKPENVVLQTCDRPNKIIYKLIDLGYAKEIDASSLAASFVGTLQYLAPEFFYSKTYSCSVDYWSLGLVAFEVMCGTRPFLPNMSPAQWMLHVQNKPSEIICIYQKENEEIIHSKEIFQENHISSCFKREVEKWFQLALEFDPKKRGYHNYNSQRTEKDLLIFSDLEHILKKKIITIFCVFTYRFYSYEIDDFTLINTLQGWMERDTKITKDEMYLLSPNCEKIDLDGLAIQCFDETYNREPMIYIFKNSKILQDDILPDIPVLVKELLENSCTMLYYFQKTTCAHALYFTMKENKYYNTVLDACNLRIKNMLRIVNEINEGSSKMTLNIQMLIAQKDLCKELLDFDVKQYLKHFSQDASHWIDSYTNVVKEIDKFSEASKRLVTRVESVYRRIGLLNSASEKEYSRYSDNELKEKLSETVSVYKAVKNKSKEKRSKPDSCVNMVKVLYNVLKYRDKLLKDKVFAQFQQKILDIDLELQKMVAPVQTALQHVDKIKSELLKDQIARQTKIWEFTIKPKPKSNEQNNAKKENTRANFILGNEMNLKIDTGKPISLEKPLHFMLGDTSSLESNISGTSSMETVKNKSLNSKEYTSINKKNAQGQIDNNLSLKKDFLKKKTVRSFQLGAPASAIIDNNQALRYELQEKTNESFLKCRSILNEDFDFSFLDN